MIEKLLQEVHPTLPLVQEQSGAVESLKLSGTSFCVTGGFEDISRDEIHAIIEENGGEVRTSVSAKLDHLIVGTDAGSKKAKAEELGVKIIDLDGLYSMLEI